MKFECKNINLKTHNIIFIVFVYLHWLAGTQAAPIRTNPGLQKHLGIHSKSVGGTVQSLTTTFIKLKQSSSNEQNAGHSTTSSLLPQLGAVN